MPSDYLKALKVAIPGQSKDAKGQEFTVEIDPTTGDRVLFTNAENAILHYVFRQEQTGLYSPLFVTALSYLLASYLVGPIVKGRTAVTAKEGLYKMYVSQLGKASASQLNQTDQRAEYRDYEPLTISDR